MIQHHLCDTHQTEYLLFHLNIMEQVSSPLCFAVDTIIIYLFFSSVFICYIAFDVGALLWNREKFQHIRLIPRFK